MRYAGRSSICAFYDEGDKGLMMEELRLLMRQIRVNNNNRKPLGVFKINYFVPPQGLALWNFS